MRSLPNKRMKANRTRLYLPCFYGVLHCQCDCPHYRTNLETVQEELLGPLLCPFRYGYRYYYLTRSLKVQQYTLYPTPQIFPGIYRPAADTSQQPAGPALQNGSSILDCYWQSSGNLVRTLSGLRYSVDADVWPY